MELTLSNLGKKYYKEWIFRNVQKTFSETSQTAVVGRNGSGKSTFLQVLAGAVIPNEGDITYVQNGKRIPSEDVFKNISFASPYLELIEDFTLNETVKFHFRFKKFYPGFNGHDVIRASSLEGKSDQPIKFFSSGMKQRVKLTLAILSDVPLVLLDEPCSNLDASGIDWYQKMIKDYTRNRTLLIASNHQKEEYSFCETVIDMDSLKKNS